jgi:ATP-dependent Clp protease ATP-binding subunit ClpX
VNASDELRCSFCGKPRSAVVHIVCGPRPDIAICDECVDLAGQIMREAGWSPPKPAEDYTSPSQ